MSSDLFSITTHKVPCQHIREYPRATFGEQEEILYLEVKQNRVSTIEDGASCSLNMKELYEPSFEELLEKSSSNGFKIRGIWIADVAMQGQSGILNERTMGNDPSWFDHPRDLLHMINTFRSEMPRPLVGMGHSMGGCHLATLSLMHPRLLSAIILIDPVINRYEKASENTIVRASTFRQDLWKSREDAERSFRRSKFYQAWDERVLQRWLKFGLRKVPTAVHPDASGEQVTLSTTKHQEVFSFYRPNFQGQNESGEDIVDRKTHADVDVTVAVHYPFYRPEPPIIVDMLPRLRPSVLFLFGGLSDVCHPQIRSALMERTGTGIGGSGGAKEGAVSEHTFEEIGHLIPMEAPAACSEVASEWLGKKLKAWAEKEAKFKEEWSKVSTREKLMVSEEWKEKIGGPLRPPKTKL
ncbi:abhydrolase domain-containing [Hyphodiscus hymeniophilus]|uniref:Abhydrolase domain-containing n=1 Tax=Hyphodiscus hymeniophilus TaxID=353542 RepID=A0A9P7B0L0_9HELO|nr:abhydrolase domain-containing [Hyphodiscus hymeniophilus]